MLISVANIKLKVSHSRKLLSWWIGPFWITKRIGIVAYCVQLPSTFKSHGAFRMSFLQPCTVYGRVQPPHLPVFEDDTSYEVEHMLSHEDRRSCCPPKKILSI